VRSTERDEADWCEAGAGAVEAATRSNFGLPRRTADLAVAAAGGRRRSRVLLRQRS